MSTGDNTGMKTGRLSSARWALLPLAIFTALAGLFLFSLWKGTSTIVPSALIGKPTPDFAMPPLAGLMLGADAVPGLASADVKGSISIVNVFASWCGPCREEHPVLIELAKDKRIRLVGLNYKDDPDNARRFLGALGNPYAAVGSDPAGRTAIDWGVYGVPESFVIAPDGTIAYKHVGALTANAVAGPINDAIEKALKR